MPVNVPLSLHREKDVRLSFRYFRKEKDKIWWGNFFRVGNTVLNNIELIEIYNFFFKSFRNVSTSFVIFSVEIEDAYSSEEEDISDALFQRKIVHQPEVDCPTPDIDICLTQTSQFQRYKNNVLIFC